MAPDPYDPDRLGRPVSEAALEALRSAPGRPRLPRPAKGELYLGGPIPMGWAERATALPGRAWHLACALWFEALCSAGRSPTVQLPPRTLRRFGLGSRTTLYRALAALAAAGLVSVEARRGRTPLVTILPVPGVGPEGRGGQMATPKKRSRTDDN